MEKGPKRARTVFFAILIFLHDIKRCDLVKFSYAMAYITLFSLVPALAAVFTLISFFSPLMGADGAMMAKVKGFVLSNLAAGTGDQVIAYLEKFLANRDLQKIGITQFAFMIVTLVFLLRQIEKALNHVFLVNKTRHIITRFIYFWTFLTLGTFVLSIGLGIAADFDLKNLVPFMGNAQKHSAGFLSFLFPPSALFCLYFLVYKLVPNCAVSARAAAFGALTATIIQTIASNFYGFYIATFFKSNPAIYGALAAVPAFLFWLFVLWAITLMGAIVTWRLEQKLNFDEVVRVVTRDPDAVTDDEGILAHQKEILIPYVCLLAVHRSFLADRGKGLTGNELAMRYTLPKKLVASGLSCLIKHELVTPNDTRDVTSADALLEQRFFPTRPAEQVSLRELNALLWQDLEEWLHAWDKSLGDDDVAQVRAHLRDLAQGLNVEVSLAQLLRANDAKAAAV